MSYMLDSVEGLSMALAENYDHLLKEEPEFVAGDVYCSRCGDYRRVNVYWDLPGGNHPGPGGARAANMSTEQLAIALVDDMVPTLLRADCVQCESQFAIVLYRRFHDAAVVVLPSQGVGVSVLGISDGVAYYLDQAGRSHHAGANSAAITMMRSAVEWILEESGYNQPMLGPKLAALESDFALRERSKMGAGNRYRVSEDS